MGSLGPGTPFDIGLAMLKNATKVDITFVPFNGNGPSINALLGGHVTSTFNSYSSISSQLKAGLARPLATASKTRIPPLPDVPTVIESGVKDYEVAPWFGVYAPAGTPGPIVKRLAEEMEKLVNSADFKRRAEDAGTYATFMGPTEFDAFTRSELVYWSDVIKTVGVKVE